ncbi:MAG: hypothetical protein AB1Z98_30190 [Nannocystaceae bacterium]
MSDPTDFVTGTIDDLLLSMADGIVYAQQSLDRLRTVDAFGKPGPTYQLPYVDFELRVAAQFTEDAVLDQRYGASAPAAVPASAKHLVMRAVAPQDTTVAGFQGEIISSLKGRFVAVPPNGGRPPLVLRTSVQSTDPQTHVLQVELRNALGEAIANQPVHFNVDPLLSAELSDADGITLAGLRPGTTLQQGVVITDAAGLATTTLSFDLGDPEPSNASVAVVIDAADRSEVLVVLAP